MCEAGWVKPAAKRAVLITTAEPSHAEELRRREIRYVIMMGLRALCLVLAAVLVSVRVPMLWLWLALCGAGMVLLPWLAVIIANDRPPKEEHRLFRRRRPQPAPPRSLPAPADPRVIDADP